MMGISKTGEKKKKRCRFLPWLNKLPQEITLEIFSKLPVESLVQCKRVLRSWHTLISDPQFINTHLLCASQATEVHPDILVFTKNWKLFRVSQVVSLNEYVKSVPYPKDIQRLCPSFMENVNTCNGLLSFPYYDYWKKEVLVLVWNPLTRKRMKPPTWKLTYRPLSYGFGYDPLLNEYKVVALFYVDSGEVEAEVFTIGSASWRRIKDVPFITWYDTSIVYLNGTLYWLGLGWQHLNGIGCFGVGDEKFQFVHEFPPEIQSVKFAELSVLRGYLHLIVCSSVDSTVLWALKKNSGGEEIWTKQYVLSMPKIDFSVHLIHLFNNGEILLMYDEAHLGYYDPKEMRFRDSETSLTIATSFADTPFCAFLHVGSLVSPAKGQG